VGLAHPVVSNPPVDRVQSSSVGISSHRDAKVTSVAVLGAGFQGVCAALELARRGVEVDLYDRHEACITQAGARNEGKIHLGFVYANDPGFETSRLLVRGALAFDAAVERWLECDIANVGLSTPHFYAVHRESLVEPHAVLAHFARVRDCVYEHARSTCSTYLGQDARTIDFEKVECGSIYDAAEIAAVVRTDERAVDVKELAERLRGRVAAEPRIRFHPRTEIVGASRQNGAVRVASVRDSLASSRDFKQVVNCLWDGKLAIDQLMQFMPGYRSSYRMKYGISVVLKRPDRSVPSTTFVVGPFGDIVRVDERRLYLSWYPVARRAMSCALTPPEWPRELSGEEARRLIDLTLAAFARLVRPMRAFHPDPVRGSHGGGRRHRRGRGD
jgi:glycerol-3-phosphate dehydrogenase